MAILVSQTLLHENKKYSNKMLFQWALNLEPQPFGFDAVLCEPSWHVLDLRSSYGHALLVLTKWSPRFKWCRKKRQFKDTASSIYLDSSEKRALDLNGSLLLLNILFLHSKASGANIAVIANSMCLWKTRMMTVRFVFASYFDLFLNWQRGKCWHTCHLCVSVCEGLSLCVWHGNV